MRPLALAFAITIGWAENASAQMSSMDALETMRQQSAIMSDNTGAPSDHFSRCFGERWTPHEQAIVSCGRVIGERESRTASATAHLERGTHYREVGDEARARTDFERAIDLYSQVILSERRSASALYYRGIALARIDESDRALADYSAASALSPEWSGGHRGAGYVHFRLSDFDAALAAFDRATSIEPENANNHAARCQALTALRSFDAAQNACSDATRLDGDNPYVYASPSDIFDTDKRGMTRRTLPSIRV